MVSDDEVLEEADPMIEGPKGDPEIPPLSVGAIIAMRVAQLDDEADGEADDDG